VICACLTDNGRAKLPLLVGRNQPGPAAGGAAPIRHIHPPGSMPASASQHAGRRPARYTQHTATASPAPTATPGTPPRLPASPATPGTQPPPVPPRPLHAAHGHRLHRLTRYTRHASPPYPLHPLHPAHSHRLSRPDRHTRHTGTASTASPATPGTPPRLTRYTRYTRHTATACPAPTATRGTRAPPAPRTEACPDGLPVPGPTDAAVGTTVRRCHVLLLQQRGHHDFIGRPAPRPGASGCRQVAKGLACSPTNDGSSRDATATRREPR
jgi:hypothetical protein